MIGVVIVAFGKYCAFASKLFPLGHYVASYSEHAPRGNRAGLESRHHGCAIRHWPRMEMFAFVIIFLLTSWGIKRQCLTFSFRRSAQSALAKVPHEIHPPSERRERQQPPASLMRRTLMAVGVALLISLTLSPHRDDWRWGKSWGWVSAFGNHFPAWINDYPNRLLWGDSIAQGVFFGVLAAVLVNVRGPSWLRPPSWRAIRRTCLVIASIVAIALVGMEFSRLLDGPQTAATAWSKAPEVTAPELSGEEVFGAPSLNSPAIDFREDAVNSAHHGKYADLFDEEFDKQWQANMSLVVGAHPELRTDERLIRLMKAALQGNEEYYKRVDGFEIAYREVVKRGR